MKALAVEDDLTSRLLLRRLLVPFGHCDEAVTGIEALQVFKEARAAQRPYQLICLDIMMPEMDGQEVLRTIRAVEEGSGVPRGKGVRILMTTALKDMQNVMSAFRELCDGYLVKPIYKEKLLQHLVEFGLIKAAGQA
jgi:two-component system chemotaxis response regulator CheY